MGEYNYGYHGFENYCYPETDVFINKQNIRNDEQLSIAEPDITSLKLL